MWMGIGSGLGRTQSGWQRVDPEAGQVPTLTMAPGTFEAGSSFSRDQPATFALDVEGLDGSLGGMIFEVGGPIAGAYVGFRADGTFIARCGDGATPWSANTAAVEIAAGQISGNGTLLVEFVPGTPVSVRVMWNGSLIGAPVQGGTSPDWSVAYKTFYLASRLDLPVG